MHRLPFIAVLSMLAASIASSFVETLAVAAPPTLTLPESISGEPGAFIVVRAESDSPWVNFKADSGLAVFPANLLADRKATVVTALSAGRFRLHAYTGNVDGGVDAVVEIVVGDAPPVPVPPVPPAPEPPKPTPPPNPPVAGPRILLLIRETAETNRPLAALVNQLRTGPQSQYLKSKGHSLQILDDDSLGSDGKPSPAVEKWRPHFSDMKLPVIFVIEKGSDGLANILAKEPLPATADAVIELVKRNGG